MFEMSTTYLNAGLMPQFKTSDLPDVTDLYQIKALQDDTRLWEQLCFEKDVVMIQDMGLTQPQYAQAFLAQPKKMFNQFLHFYEMKFQESDKGWFYGVLLHSVPRYERVRRKIENAVKKEYKQLQSILKKKQRIVFNTYEEALHVIEKIAQQSIYHHLTYSIEKKYTSTLKGPWHLREKRNFEGFCIKSNFFENQEFVINSIDIAGKMLFATRSPTFSPVHARAIYEAYRHSHKTIDLEEYAYFKIVRQGTGKKN